MRTIEQLHNAALNIIATAPTQTLSCVAGEIAAVIDATATRMIERPDNDPAKLIFQQYATTKKHNPNTKLTISASKLFALTSLIN